MCFIIARLHTQSGEWEIFSQRAVKLTIFYNLADFPGILSGDQVGFLDPHESCFTYRENEHAPKQHTSSQCWKLSNPDLKSELRDQVEPFLHKLFGSEDCLETEEFNGTVFRFPLRQNSAQSRLCKTVYDNDKVHNLFRMFSLGAFFLHLAQRGKCGKLLFQIGHRHAMYFNYIKVLRRNSCAYSNWRFCDVFLRKHRWCSCLYQQRG